MKRLWLYIFIHTTSPQNTVYFEFTGLLFLRLLPVPISILYFLAKISCNFVQDKLAHMIRIILRITFLCFFFLIY